MCEDIAGVHWVLPEKLLIKLAQSPSSMPDAIRKSTKGVHFSGLSKADAVQVSLLLLGQSFFPALPVRAPVMHSYVLNACLERSHLSFCIYWQCCMSTALDCDTMCRGGGHDDMTKSLQARESCRNEMDSTVLLMQLCRLLEENRRACIPEKPIAIHEPAQLHYL